MSEFDRPIDVLSKKLSRRGFIKIAAAMSFLAGCRAAGPTSTPTPTSRPTDTPRPQLTPTPSPTPPPAPTPTVPLGRPEVIEMYPDVASKIVHTHHEGVWSGEDLEPNALRQMLDASITELTGLNDAAEAWGALFRPGERVAIKVNAFRNSLIWTHLPLVMAITDALQDAGIGADQIVIFDYSTGELEEAGYPVNKDGAGVRCYGTDGDYVGDWDVVSDIVRRNTQLSRILMDCDALINVPVLKSHRLAGLSFAMKNHYGTIPNPESYHSGRAINQGMAELNALPPIRDRTRLIVGDMLAACLHYKHAYPYWEADWQGDSIMMSFDPVAHDTVGLDILSNLLEGAMGLTNRASPWLKSGAKIGLGTNNPDDMELIERRLG